METEHPKTSYNDTARALPGTAFTGWETPEIPSQVLDYSRGRYLLRFFVWYPKRSLLVVTPKPHVDKGQWQSEQQVIFCPDTQTTLSRKQTLTHCPSLAKFNGCNECPHTFGSLPCIAKVYPDLKGKHIQEDVLDWSKLPSSYSARFYHSRTEKKGEIRSIACSHVTLGSYRRFRYRQLVGIENYQGDHASLEEGLEMAHQSAKRAVQTREKIAAQCPQCYFFSHCEKRWRAKYCNEAYLVQHVHAYLAHRVEEALQQIKLSREELVFFVEAGGHTIYPNRGALTFVGVDLSRNRGVFYSDRGRYKQIFDLPTTRYLLRASYFREGLYTTPFRPSLTDLTDELLGSYLELMRSDSIKTSRGWGGAARIKSVSSLGSDRLFVDTFTSASLRVTSYNSLMGSTPYQLSYLS